MKEYTNIEQLMSELEEGKFNYFALRNATEHDLKILESGRDYLDSSHNWIDNVDTEEELGGSCGICITEYMKESEILNRFNRCLNIYEGNTILLIADNLQEYGEDEDEVILGSNGYGANVLGYVKF